MPLRSDWSQDSCPVARGVDALGDPWVLLILRELLGGASRFDELRDALEIADNMLAKRLASMVEAGLVVKQPYEQGRRGRSRYRPTRAGADALPILHAYALWAQKYTPSETRERQLSIVCLGCGQASSSGETCSHCGRELTAETTAWVRPGSADPAPVPLTRALLP